MGLIGGCHILVLPPTDNKMMLTTSFAALAASLAVARAAPSAFK